MAENSEWKNDEEEARARKEAEAAVRHARDYHMRKQGYWKGFFVGFFACVAVLAVAAAVLFFRVSGNRRPYRADKTTQATPAEASAIIIACGFILSRVLSRQRRAPIREI